MIIINAHYHGELNLITLKGFTIEYYEFMLQQTQVKTVIPYFIKFTKEIKH